MVALTYDRRRDDQCRYFCADAERKGVPIRACSLSNKVNNVKICYKRCPKMRCLRTVPVKYKVFFYYSKMTRKEMCSEW